MVRWSVRRNPFRYSAWILRGQFYDGFRDFKGGGWPRDDKTRARNRHKKSVRNDSGAGMLRSYGTLFEARSCYSRWPGFRGWWWWRWRRWRTDGSALSELPLTRLRLHPPSHATVITHTPPRLPSPLLSPCLPPNVTYLAVDDHVLITPRTPASNAVQRVNSASERGSNNRRKSYGLVGVLRWKDTCPLSTWSG